MVHVQGLHAEFDFSLVSFNPVSAAANLPFEVVATSGMGEAAIILTGELDYEDVNQRFFQFMVRV